MGVWVGSRKGCVQQMEDLRWPSLGTRKAGRGVGTGDVIPQIRNVEGIGK